MRSLIIYKIEFFGACNFFNIPHIHVDDASKVNWKQHQIDVKRCQEDISEIDSSFNKTDRHFGFSSVTVDPIRQQRMFVFLMITT